MSGAQARLSQVKDILTFNKTATTIPFDPDCTKFPNRKDVPRRADAPRDAAWVWGEDDQVISSSFSCSAPLTSDQLGRINLLTPTRVKAASAEIKTGETISLKCALAPRIWLPWANCNSLPLTEPGTPCFHRETFKHEIKDLAEGKAFDDLYTLNTQSGTQWDGFRHVLHLSG